MEVISDPRENIPNKQYQVRLVEKKIELTQRTLKSIHVLFDKKDHISVEKLLLSDCSINIPDCSAWNSESLERLWISVLKISAGNIEQLNSAIALAQTDYRDVFMAAGFGHDVNAHQKWAP